MSTHLTPLSGPEPDEIDLELLFAGAIDDPAAVRRVTEAAQGPLADTAAEIEAYRAAWAAADRLPLAALFPVPQPSQPLGEAPRWRGALGWGLALAAAAVLTVSALSGGLGPHPRPLLDAGSSAVRTMGLLPVDVSVVRGDAQIAPTPGYFRGDDRLWLAVPAPSGGYVSVLALGEAGEVTMLARSRAESPLAAGETFSLDGALHLDHDDSKEWIVVLVDATLRSDADLEREVLSLLPDPTTRATGCCAWALDVTRGH